ncbi:beta-hexosaminidase subunit beta-like isoform X2 [Sitophilus oryzae]|uniref:Beta-hexosaminidase n=1 Tax=Sitophilus oryzae TaxID=7048 RepID=A0A6J2YI55_SITOR|nr:beta-hexosaminidase subunit beta-like isoform X2 [Sitophilus oryzae]
MDLSYKNGKKFIYFILCGFLINLVSGVNPGPQVIATKGAIWPKPQRQNISDSYFILKPGKFQFVLSDITKNCGILQSALDRYLKIIQQNEILTKDTLKYRKPHDKNKKSWHFREKFLGYLDQLTINLSQTCDDTKYPDLEMDEHYYLVINQTTFKLEAASFWGILRGLESFSQLLYLGDDLLSLRINQTEIVDFPRYKHRGLLIDTSRHFLPLNVIYKTLDAMSYNKMNVLHWHIVDDQSFPYVSIRFPELSNLGSFNPYTKTYTPEDINSIIEYGKVRGIRIIPEFDTPGHTRSWGVSHPELLTECQELDTFGPLDPTKAETYSFMNNLLAEVKVLFKDQFLHLGGDEVDFTCWMGSQNITEFMKKYNISSYFALESYYVQKIVDMTEKLKLNSIVWEEVFHNGVKLPQSTVVQVWKGDWKETIKNVTESGYQALLSSCWYLDNIQSGGDWTSFYNCDPSVFNGTENQQNLVLGGDACMWGEVVNEHNLISRVWPRASAPAEKLWSAKNKDPDLDEVARRLEEHTCRMNRRNIGAEPPNGPGYCD